MKKIALPALVVILVLFFAVWGRSYPTPKILSATRPEVYPVATPAVIPKLQPIVFHGSRNKKEVALTFDADMTSKMKKNLLERKVKSWYNKEVVDILAKTGTKATLFLSGMWIEIYSQEAKDLAQNPLFELGNHSYSHPGFTNNCFGLNTIANSQDKEEVEKTQDLLKKIGVDNKLFRFPGGCYDDFDVETVQNLGLTAIQWDVEGRDGFNDSTRSVINNVVNNVQNGSIVVLHMHGGPNAPKTAEALPEIISSLRAKGYSFVKVSELLHGI